MSLAHDVSLACRVLLGTVCAISVLSKVRSRAAWRSYCSWLTGMPLGPLRRNGAPAALAVAELAVVVLVVSPFAAAGLAAGSALCLALTFGLSVAVRRGSWQPCHCFGSSSEPLGRQHVARNALLLLSALTGLLGAIAAGGRSPGAAEAGLAAIGGLAAAILIIFFGDIAAVLNLPAIGVPGAGPAHRAETR